jgi:hypothetical protein
MAFYVRIVKTAENEHSATYSFEGQPGRLGLLRIPKHGGDVELLEAAPGDEHSHYYLRAAAKLIKEREAGHFPDVTAWAS